MIMDVPYETRVQEKAEELARYFYPLRYSDYWIERCLPLARLIISDMDTCFMEGFDHGQRKVDEYKRGSVN